ncbi:MAG: PaaI family thioesterase [Pseudomonadota bacterium]
MFKPRDPEFEAKVKTSFAKQGAMQLIGGELIAVEPGLVTLEMPMKDTITQQNGFVHAGIITTMMDSAAGYAAFSLMEPEAAVLTIEFKTNLMAPARGNRFRFIGRVIKPGKTITFCEAEAIALEAGLPDQKVSTMSATMMAVTDRPLIRP